MIPNNCLPTAVDGLVFRLSSHEAERGDSSFTPYLDRWKQLRDGPWFE
jgi:hypothetical protein